MTLETELAWPTVIGYLLAFAIKTHTFFLKSHISLCIHQNHETYLLRGRKSDVSHVPNHSPTDGQGDCDLSRLSHRVSNPLGDYVTFCLHFEGVSRSNYYFCKLWQILDFITGSLCKAVDL